MEGADATGSTLADVTKTLHELGVDSATKQSNNKEVGSLTKHADDRGKKRKESERKKEQMLRKKAAAKEAKVAQNTSTKGSKAVPTGLFELKLTEKKGYGLFATQLIKRGTRILSETPLLSVGPDRGDLYDNIWLACIRLAPDIKEKYLELHNYRDPNLLDSFVTHRVSRCLRSGDPGLYAEAFEEELNVLSTFKTNCVEMGPEAEYGLGVFALYSRINHSCLPNVSNSFNFSLGRETVHAVRDIQAGEEIVTSYYHDTCQPLDVRQQKLSEYGIVCDCAACRSPASERRRKRLFYLDQSRAFYARSIPSIPFDGQFASISKSDSQALKVTKEIIGLLGMEGIMDTGLCNEYRKASSLNMKLGKLGIALEWAKKELEVDEYCKGSDSASYQDIVAWIKMLETKVATVTLKKEGV